MISQLAAIVAPVFMVTLAGFVWRRLGNHFDQGMATRLISDISVPCLVFATLTSASVNATLFAHAAWATLAVAATTCAIAYVILRAARLPVKVYLPSLTFPNIGNMGIPICLYAYGQQGMALATLYFGITSLLQFTVGSAIAQGKFALKPLLKSPFIYTIVLALAIKMAGLHVPIWVTNTTALAGSLAIPLMLLALGVALAELRITSLRRATALSLLRLGLGATVGTGIAMLFGFTGAARGVLIIESTMPVAIFNYLFALMYDNSPEEVAGMVMMSTLISYITLPLLIAIVV